MKKLVSFIALSVIIITPLSVSAEKPDSKAADLKKEIRIDLQQGRKDLKESSQSGKNINGKVVQGTVASIGTSSFTVTSNGQTYTVNIDGKTKFRRHFWGKSALSEISVGDKVNILGKFTDSAKTTILARMVRDTSIQKRKGTFFGTVTATGTTLTISTTKGTESVLFDGSTKLVNRKEQVITSSQINVGDKVRVKGVWDKTLNTITEVTQIKDFTQPAVVSPTPSVVPSPVI